MRVGWERSGAPAGGRTPATTTNYQLCKIIIKNNNYIEINNHDIQNHISTIPIQSPF
jgi:hypothetical protein